MPDRGAVSEQAGLVPTRVRRFRAVAAVVGFCVVAVAAQLLRQPGAPTWNTVWAEDGALYTSEAYALPAWSTLLRGYAGYAQLVPRVIALGTRLLPVGWVAPYLAASSALVCALLALFVLRSMDGWVTSRYLQGLVVVMTVLTPALFFEVNANIANLGWPLLFASFWAIASRRRTTVDVALRAVVVAATALTTPLFVLLVPWAAVLAAVRRARADAVVLAAGLAALAVQWLAIRATSPRPRGASYARDVPTEYGVRVLGSLVFGEKWLDRLWIRLDGWMVAVAIVAIVVVIVLAAPWRWDGRRRTFVAVGAVLSVVLFVVPVWVRGTAEMSLVRDAFTTAGSRYVVVPVLLLVSAIVVAVDGSRRRWLTGLVVVHGVVLVVVCFGLANLRADGPAWSTQVATARATCRAADPPPAVVIPITPAGSGWLVVVPCRRLVGD